MVILKYNGLKVIVVYICHNHEYKSCENRHNLKRIICVNTNAKYKFHSANDRQKYVTYKLLVKRKISNTNYPFNNNL